ncbi:lactate utilization protein [Lentimicrobium sp.]|jgi:hypothetical protein|uniref:lactate utilization protein n=1 Tax=Lentimicrobium sp. TaxID=2034841 RepID=UPI0025D264EC|nr:lactate utilization protein [Lentimicrobium sp.]MCO5255167.1 lactate utilization protein [Lentimicrobium sp.]MCO5262867.1 lactate utilization protein [Lentimicrobium sp.]HOP13847.1 lactate utilization protein [Lentimicrobium sp.]HPF64237.1 lactate utilization protein [Lentimicrobium sp.]HPJ60952.1 lactate utilization protein [Lentimicrobium sp.]
MNEYQEWHHTTIADKVIGNLKRNQFEAIYFKTAVEASEYICNRIKPGMKVAFGGSMTIRALGIREKAIAMGATLIDHGKPGLTEAERLEEMRRELTADIFLSSTNALTLRGELINVDGYGNRVAAMIFGPGQVMVVAGINKLVRDEQAAFERLKSTAGPMNMKRLGRNTPCTSDGICHNCLSEERGCRAYTIIRKRPAHTPTTVIIVGENLGM